MTRILTVVGARPQFIKAATVSRVTRDRDDVTEILVHTGQHYDQNMSELFFQEMDIPTPDHNLAIGSGSHGAQTGAMLEAVERVIQQEEPDWVLIYGDTNSTLAGAVAAVKLHVPVVHVEAGLRSFNRRMPEEINRILSDHASDLLLTPTDTATMHLRNEGVPDEKVVQVGDVMYDAALFYGERAGDPTDMLDRLGVDPSNCILSTIHRAENTDDTERMTAIIEAFAAINREHQILLPLHPRTRATLERLDLLEAMSSAATLCEPLGYLDMVAMERAAGLVLTDSGGVQKEAFFHGTPCVTLRDETEWVELVDAGWNTICPPPDVNAIVEAACSAFGTTGSDIEPYGDGDAAARIVDLLVNIPA